MKYRLAKSLETLRSQINAAYPGRDKTSDGWIGDLSHKNRKSDHNPNSAGVVTAIDIDEDLAPNIHSIEAIVSELRASRDPRIKYIIYEKRITVPGSQLQIWKKYTGPSPHDHHAHISVSSDPRLYDDAREWAFTPELKSQNDTSSSPILQAGSRGIPVKKLQARLVELGYQIKIDSDFGPATQAAVMNYQRKKGLTADGKVGPNTREALGI